MKWKTNSDKRFSFQFSIFLWTQIKPYQDRWISSCCAYNKNLVFFMRTGTSLIYLCIAYFSFESPIYSTKKRNIPLYCISISLKTHISDEETNHNQSNRFFFDKLFFYFNHQEYAIKWFYRVWMLSMMRMTLILWID